MVFRRGQWVSTSLAIEGAHTTPDGRSVGVYNPAYKDSLGEEVPEQVSIIKPDGTNLVRLEGDVAVSVTFPPSELPDLKALVDPEHLPESRRPAKSSA
jgi:hypothetical protein